MEAVFERAFTTGVIAALVLMGAYQGFMLWWTKRTTGSIPKTIIWLRAINIGFLVLTGVLIAIWLGRR